MEEEIYILGPPLLEIARGSLCNRRDARDKNLCVNLLNFLGVYGKTKDTADARQDQQLMHGRDNLNPESYPGTASYALTKEEKEIFF